jgi:hypothetical protein
MYKPITLSTETIESLKEQISELDFDSEEMEELLKLRKKSYSDSLSLGILYFKCYNILSENKSIEEIKKLISKFELKKEFRELVEFYNTKELTYYIGEKIRKYSINNKEQFENLIDLFFILFKED